MKKIYIAGPEVFRSDAVEYFKWVRERCAAHGVEALIPLDNEIPSEGLLPREVAGGIFLANLAMINQCDAVIANLTPFRGVSIDAGTAVEIGYALAKRKPVVGYTYEHRLYKTRVPNPAPSYPIVEDFGLEDNLMVCMALYALRGSFEEALSYVSSLMLDTNAKA